MKRKKSLLALGLACVMSSTLLAGCGSNDSTPAPSGSTENKAEAPASSSASAENAAAEEVTYPLEGDISLTYGYTVSSKWNDYYEYFDEIPLGQALEENTGVNLEMVQVADKTAMNLLLASGELPDIITFNFANNYTGGNEKAMSDGLVYQMTEEFVQTYAPDYWKYLEENPEVYRQVKTSDGYIFGFAFMLLHDELLAQQGIIVRDDWMDDLGIADPETPEEFEEMLVRFRDEKGATIPLEVSADGLNSLLSRGYITTPFNLVTMDKYMKDGEVHIGYAEEEFKAVLEWLHHLYEEGLLDPNFATVDKDTVTANMSTGVSGVSQGAAGSGIQTWENAATEEGFSLTGIKGLVANKGDVPMYGHYNYSVPGNMSILSSTCSDPVAAAKYFNYGYTKEGYMLYNYGIEGITYIADENGDYVSSTEEAKNGDVVSALYNLSYGNGPYEACVPDFSGYQFDGMTEARSVAWINHNAVEYIYPNASVSADLTSEYSSLVSELETYRDEMIIKFVRGDESLDNFSNYLDNLNKMGIDRLKELLQGAADAYYAK